MTNLARLLWFIFGLGSQTQFLASLSFSEAFVLVAAPFVFIGELPHMRRNGVMPLFILSISVVIGCVVSCIANRTPSVCMIRGLAVTCLLSCSIVVCHWMMRKHMNGFKWWLVGAAVSGIVCTFVFQKSVEVTQLAGGDAGASASRDIMNGTLYWIGRLKSFAILPSNGWYLQCPLSYSILAPLGIAVFALLTSISGRSAAATAIASACLVVIGGKTRKSMMRIGKYFYLLVVLGVVAACIVKAIYTYSASSGMLGEDARRKYERQTHGDSSFKSILLGGRFDSFCGLLACVDKPIIGFGPWALDNNGYVAEFLNRYAGAEDFANYIRYETAMKERGVYYARLIPCHSIIVMFWLWYGVAGLVFWLYVCYVFIRYLRQDCWAVPQWYMWLAAGLPIWFWNILFSPLGDRVGSMMFIVACLLARAVRLGVQPLPLDMIEEINARRV